MNLSKIFLLLIVLCIPPILPADEASEKEAEKLLDMMGMQEMMDQSVSQMLDIQLQQQPDLAPFKGVMIEFFNKNMSYESIKPELIKMYSEAFTASELKEIIAKNLKEDDALKLNTIIEDRPLITKSQLKYKK